MEAGRVAPPNSQGMRGLVEQAGVDYLPESARDSSLTAVGLILGGSLFSLPSVVFGWISFGLGLNFWQTLSSYLVGSVFGVAITFILPMMGPATGTNMTVASGAHFGIRGRFVGSAIVLLFALSFGAVTVWTSGDAVTATASRLFGIQFGVPLRAVIYGLVAAGMGTLAVFGYQMIVRAMRILVPLFVIAMLFGLTAFGGDFDPATSTGQYALGSFMSTWSLSAIFGVAGFVGTAVALADYTRKLPNRYSEKQVCWSVMLAVLIGNTVPPLFGAFTAASFGGVGPSYVDDLIRYSPFWYLPAIIVMAVCGGVSFGVLTIYSSGLDLEGIFPRLRRYQTTAITAIACITLTYLGAFVLDATDAISEFTTLLTIVSTAWVTVLLVGLIATLRNGRGYDVMALHDFASGIRGGVYWFVGGFNPAACASFALGSVFGVVTADTSLAVSILGTAAITALLFGAFRAMGWSGEPRWSVSGPTRVRGERRTSNNDRAI